MALFVLDAGVWTGGAYAATVSKPGFSATVTAGVTPKRLSKKGGTPVKLAIAGSITRQSYFESPRLDSFDIALDPQLTVDATGLPVCTDEVSFREDVEPAEAMRECGSALVGRGSYRETFPVPEAFPPSYTTDYTTLFFNAEDKGRPAVLLYTFANVQRGELPRSQAATVGTGQHLHFEAFDEASYATETLFRFALGKTWQYRGTRHSYLSGTCSKGRLKNRILLTVDGQATSSAAPVRCARKGR